MSGAGVDVDARFKEVSEVPSCSHCSLSMNWVLVAAGLVSTASKWRSSL
ncbi:hypothetical protein ACFC5Z_15685 [Streptomyces sp. NPDC056004]